MMREVRWFSDEVAPVTPEQWTFLQKRHKEMTTDPKFCKDCKHFWPNEVFHNESDRIRHGHCLLAPAQIDYRPVTGGTRIERGDYRLAVTSRNQVDLCGPSAKLFEPKSPSEALAAKPKPQSNWFRRLLRL